MTSFCPRRFSRAGGLDVSSLEWLVIGLLLISLMVPLTMIGWRTKRLNHENKALEPGIQAIAALTDREFPGLAPRVKTDFRLAGIPELMRVPGIGTSTVEKLVKVRAEAERPITVEELRTSEGIGPRKWELLAGYFEFSKDPLPPLPRLNLNKATAAELEMLPGLGPILAEEMIATRNRLGGFRTLDDLQEVPGLTEACYNRFSALVTLE